MKLKVKFLKWSAGIPGVMLHKKTANKMGVQISGKVSIKTLKKYPKEFSTSVNTIEGVVEENEILVSAETKSKLGLKENESVDVNIAPSPKSIIYIKKKLQGKKLNEKEIYLIIEDIVKNNLSEPEVALFVSVMYEKGMTFKEIFSLIKAILNSGNQLKFKQKDLADKHSIGGIPGNRTTPIVIAICAAAGLNMPKTSSKAITSAAGTADVMEVLMKIEFNPRELQKILTKVGAFMVWGGALSLVPADSKIIKIEKELKIDPEAQLLASIMSKKLAVGSKHILIDIPYGKTAKVTKSRALKLKKKFEIIGKHFKRNLKVVLTDGSQPIGRGVGPVLELIDVIKILNPKEKGPKDLEEKSIFLAAQLLEMTKKVKKGKGIGLAEEILYSGKAFKKFKEIIKAQEGKLIELKLSEYKKDILAKKNGKIKEIDNKKINLLARSAGCPADKYAGLDLNKKVGEIVKKGESIITIYSQSKPRLEEATKLYLNLNPIKIK